MKKIRAFIPAAGFGERLRPITNHIPKPLLPVLGKPIIESITEKVLAIPVERVGINLHCKAEMILRWATTSRDTEKIELFHEEEILGTGGALRNAAHFLCGAAFIVHNADICSDVDLRVLIEKHFVAGNTVTLAVHNHNDYNNVWVNEGGRLLSVGGSCPEGGDGYRRVAFTGIAVYSPDFLDLLPAGTSSVVDAWLRAVKLGLKVGSVEFEGCRWTDVGTPEAFAGLVFSSLKERGEMLYIHPAVECNEAELGAQTVIEEGCVIGKGASVRNAILLPGANVKEGLHIRDAIIGPGYEISIKEAPTVPSSMSGSLVSGLLSDSCGDVEMSLIGVGGSDRNYYRITAGDKTAVLMECPEDDPDFQRQIIYTHFLRRYSVPVPELLGSDSRGNAWPVFAKRGYVYALFEDLGDISLYSWRGCKSNGPLAEDLYRRILDIMVNLHTRVSDNVSECLLLRSRVFDAEYLRWETSYFIERFVCGLLGFDVADKSSLAKECDRLAARVDAFEKVVVHRDFQSQNVMIARGGVPRVLDYQGARMGPAAYDLASLLWDPYAVLDSDCRERLLDYYFARFKDYRGGAFDESALRTTIIPCRLQRHMQALGAYGFLSVVKGRKYFLRYVPQALEYLKEEAKAVKESYPVLFELIMSLDEKIECRF